MRRLALIWIACAALSWALTVVVGYSVMRFGDDTKGDQVIAEGAATDPSSAEAEALSAITPAAGLSSTTGAEAE